MKKTAVVTGGSSGIGKATAVRLAKDGYNVYDLSRHDVHTDGIRHITADVTDIGSIKEAVRQIIREEKSIDLLVCCAGMGVSGAVEFISEEETRRQFDVKAKRVEPHTPLIKNFTHIRAFLL